MDLGFGFDATFGLEKKDGLLKNTFNNIGANPYTLNLTYCDDPEFKTRLDQMNLEFSKDPRNFDPAKFHSTYTNTEQTNVENINPDQSQFDEQAEKEKMMSSINKGNEKVNDPQPGKLYNISSFIVENPLVVVNRDEWGALPSSRVRAPKYPIKNIVISYKSQTAPCFNKDECMQRMRELQKYYMEKEGMSDIPYNFMVGHDGTIYEARGWNAQSSKSLTFFPNLKEDRLDIAYLGDYREAIYPVETNVAILDLAKVGMDEGMVHTYCDFIDWREGIQETLD